MKLYETDPLLARLAQEITTLGEAKAEEALGLGSEYFATSVKWQFFKGAYVIADEKFRMRVGKTMMAGMPMHGYTSRPTDAKALTFVDDELVIPQQQFNFQEVSKGLSFDRGIQISGALNTEFLRPRTRQKFVQNEVNFITEPVDASHNDAIAFTNQLISLGRPEGIRGRMKALFHQVTEEELALVRDRLVQGDIKKVSIYDLCWDDLPADYPYPALPQE